MDEKIKITSEEKSELARRMSIIGFYEQTLALLNSEKNLFLHHLFVEKGLDPTKNYRIDEEDNLIEEG
jgi:hypothetical protein